MKKPERPSAVKAASTKAAKLAAGELDRLVLKLPIETKRAIKARAASQGITCAAYFIRLARQDGVEVVELPGGNESD